MIPVFLSIPALLQRSRRLAGSDGKGVDRKTSSLIPASGKKRDTYAEPDHGEECFCYYLPIESTYFCVLHAILLDLD